MGAGWERAAGGWCWSGGAAIGSRPVVSALIRAERNLFIAQPLRNPAVVVSLSLPRHYYFFGNKVAACTTFPSNLFVFLFSFRLAWRTWPRVGMKYFRGGG